MEQNWKKILLGLTIISIIFLSLGCTQPGETTTTTSTTQETTTTTTQEKFTEEKAKKKAMNFVKHSPTYVFDGEKLTYKETLYPDHCENCWQFVFEFKSRHAGYGNRSGEMVAQVITPHEAIVTVEDKRITNAVLDGKWDMMKQEMLGQEKPEVTEEKSRQIARKFVENSPTYKYDGLNLTLKKTETLRCPSCWQFVFEFKSRHAGYGNRSDQMLAQVITPHEAIVTVVRGNVTKAYLDGNWDMVHQSALKDKNKGLDQQTCETAGGKWNNCSNKCKLDNQGKNVACPAVCEPLCECAGAAGYTCPEGYECQVKSNVTDALGYCVPETTDKNGFCGFSTNASCKTDADCVTGGCSGQVCQSTEEEIATTCEYKDCYDAGKYGLSCQCVGGECKWD